MLILLVSIKAQHVRFRRSLKIKLRHQSQVNSEPARAVTAIITAD